jgi:cobalt/nickel transport system permease protein
MHIPDGFLSAPVAATCAALSASAVGAAGMRSRAMLGSRAVAMMGVAAAFVFAAQMLNFPVAGGTSGHLVGGVLVAVLLGPAAAVIVMTAVLVVQCLVFADGGLLALGANVFNMGVVQPLVGFVVYRVVAGRVGRAPPSPARRISAAAFAAWIATVFASATCAGELSLSSVVSPSLVFAAMTGVHAAIGLGEGLITAIVLSTVLRFRPDLVDRDRESSSSAGSLAVLGVVASSGLAFFLSPFACRWPDGLERVVERLGIEPARARLSMPAPLRDYAIPGLGVHGLSTSVAAGLGTLFTFGLSCAIGAWLAPRPARGEAEHGGASSRGP